MAECALINLLFHKYRYTGRGEERAAERVGEEKKTEQCALIKVIKGLTELCLDVFIQLIEQSGRRLFDFYND